MEWLPQTDIYPVLTMEFLAFLSLEICKGKQDLVGGVRVGSGWGSYFVSILKAPGIVCWHHKQMQRLLVLKDVLWMNLLQANSQSEDNTVASTSDHFIVWTWAIASKD